MFRGGLKGLTWLFLCFISTSWPVQAMANPFIHEAKPIYNRPQPTYGTLPIRQPRQWLPDSGPLEPAACQIKNPKCTPTPISTSPRRSNAYF